MQLTVLGTYRWLVLRTLYSIITFNTTLSTPLLDFVRNVPIRVFLNSVHCSFQ